MNCSICDQTALDEIEAYRELPRVTSDCKPWPVGGRLAICMGCGAVQKYRDQKWRGEADDIYRDYEIYHQSAGVEQGVFDPATGKASPRSIRIARFLDQTLKLHDTGSILDVGCGSGVTLAAFSEVKKNWALYGFDLDQRGKERLRKLPNFHKLYYGRTADVPDEYTVVSLIHVAEHLPDPRSELEHLKPCLGASSRLVIQVPNFRHNPFDLMVADHLMHFSLESLRRLVEAAGYQVEIERDDVVPKEITLTALRNDSAGHISEFDVQPSMLRQFIEKQLSWLSRVIESARDISAQGTLGIFGTSIAGAWMFGALGDRIKFYVDEDLSRIGRHFMGKPVYGIQDIPKGADVYIPLAPLVAKNIWQRNQGSVATFHLPPAAEW